MDHTTADVHELTHEARATPAARGRLAAQWKMTCILRGRRKCSERAAQRVGGVRVSGREGGEEQLILGPIRCYKELHESSSCDAACCVRGACVGARSGGGRGGAAGTCDCEQNAQKSVWYSRRRCHHHRPFLS